MLMNDNNQQTQEGLEKLRKMKQIEMKGNNVDAEDKKIY